MLEVNPFERMNWLAHGRSEDLIAYRVVFKHEMWWFQIRTQVIAKYVPSLLEYLSMQAGFRWGTSRTWGLSLSVGSRRRHASVRHQHGLRLCGHSANRASHQPS
jgi:hypothetical protein